MALYREQGIVLRTYKLGEADRIVCLLTQGRGKVRAVAKGVRRPTSRLGGRLEPFSHVDLQLYEGRNLDIVTQVELITPHAAVRADFALSACGSAMAEATDRVAQEGERSNPLFLLLIDGLRALSRPAADPAAMLDAWLLRLAGVAGYHPYLDACAGCGLPGAHSVFHIAAGGLLCPACAPAGARGMDPAAVALLRRLARTDLVDVCLAPHETPVRRTAAALVNSFVTYHLGKPLKSWDLVPR
ncbi:MAG TPA: DNA repair protein RecO [Egibacteraceae bacterium]|nr:DNA repair protein RecO [Egibacteraceae bacterium]